MDRWKSRGRKSQRGEEKKRQDQRRERLRRKKMQAREKVDKLRNPLFSNDLWLRRVESRLAKLHAKRISKSKCTKHTMLRAPLDVRNTFGSCDVEKVHAVVARSTYPSQNVQNRPFPDHFWKLRWWKSCGAKHISKSKFAKHTRFGALLEVEMSKSVRTCGAKHMSKSKFKKTRCSGRYKRHVHQMLGGRGAYFPRGVAFWSIRSSVWEDDFVWQVQHIVWPGITFSWQTQYFRDMHWQDHKTHWHEAVSSALNFPWLKEVLQFCFVFEAANFKIEEVSQNCVTSDDVKFKISEISQNCFVFKLADRQIDWWMDGWTDW